MNLIDLTAKAPASYRVRTRRPEEITTVVLHQTGFSWKPSNPRWAKVRAHYVVRRDGSVLLLHHPETRMRYGSSVANRYCVTIEHEGNYANASGSWWKPELYGAHHPTPELIAASRDLLRFLHESYPSIVDVSSHRHIQAGKSNCCGPELWQALGVWAIEEPGLREAPVLVGGKPLPAAWWDTAAMVGTTPAAVPAIV